jgi:hypothetical protein
MLMEEWKVFFKFILYDFAYLIGLDVCLWHTQSVVKLIKQLIYGIV